MNKLSNKVAPRRMSLEQAARHVVDVSELEFDNRGRPTLASLGLMHEAITAMREALAELVRKCDGLLCNDCGEYKQRYKDLPGLTEKDLCVCSLAEQVEQEPMATVVDESEEQTNTMSWILSLPLPVGTKLYAAPVCTKDLTDDEIGSIYEKHHALGGCWTDGFAYERAVIAAYKEKNK